MECVGLNLILEFLRDCIFSSCFFFLSLALMYSSHKGLHTLLIIVRALALASPLHNLTS